MKRPDTHSNSNEFLPFEKKTSPELDYPRPVKKKEKQLPHPTKRITLGQCTYNPETRQLCDQAGKNQIIGHVQAELLYKLYTNPNVYFSSEELQKDVWNNRFIEKTTIRTTVSYLRKALGETKECKYIESGRNKGYRFIAHIEEVSDKKKTNNIVPITAISTFTIILLMVSIFAYTLIDSTSVKNKPQIQTTLFGQEIEASVKNKLLLFSHKPHGGSYWNLYTKRLGEGQLGGEQYHRLTNGNHNDNRSAFSKNGQRLAFNRHDSDGCRVMIADFDQKNMLLKNVKTAFDCRDKLLSISLTWKDDNNLYMSYSKSINQPYQIYSFNLDSGMHSPITFPPDNGRGDYYVSSAPNSEKTIFLRNIGDSKTEIWLYDKPELAPKKLAIIPLTLMSVAWTDSDNSLIVRTSNTQLSKLDINSGKLETLFEANYPIYFPFSSAQQTIGYMRGSIWKKDIVKYNLNGQSENIITSSFSDYWPIHAKNTSDIAFVSNRTGQSQIWRLSNEGELNQITHFKNEYEIIDLAISQDGKLIAFTLDGRLQVVGRNGEILHSAETQDNYKNPTFSHDGKYVHYSINDNGRWFIESQSIAQKSDKIRVGEGYVIIPCEQNNCFYFTKYKDPTLYKFVDNKFHTTGIQLSQIESSSQISIVKDDIYYLSNTEQPEILNQNFKSNAIKHILKLPTPHFSVAQNPLRFFTSVRRESETNLESFSAVQTLNTSSVRKKINGCHPYPLCEMNVQVYTKPRKIQNVAF